MYENTYTHISPQAYFNLYKDLQQHNNPAKTKEQLDMVNRKIIVQLTDLLREINEDIKNLPRCPISEGHE
jgi:hypothetical protein